MKFWKRKAFEEANADIIAVEDAGYTVTRFTDWHWRITRDHDFSINVWPSERKWMKNSDRIIRIYKKIGDVCP